MTEHPDLSNLLRVPEPQQILAWLQDRWDRVRAYGREPEHRLLLGILLVAAVLRLAYLDLIEFKMDEAQHLLRSAQLVEQSQWPVTGTQASVGIAKPPLMVFLMALPLLLGRDPRIASAFIAVLNVAAVGFCYRLARRYYGIRVATVSAALFAVNPWAVIYSRKAFTADLLAPLSLVFLWGILDAVVSRRARGWIWSSVGMGLLLNLTFSPAPLLLVFLLIIVLYRDRVRWLYLLFGTCLSLLMFTPYLYYLNRDRLGDVRTLLTAAGSAGGDLLGLVRPFQYAAWLHSDHNLASLAGASAAEFAPSYSIFRPLDGLAILLFLGSLIAVIGLALRTWSHWRKREDAAKYTVVALWLWVTLLFWMVFLPRLEFHYLIVLYPAGFLSMGIIFDRLLLLPESKLLRSYWWSSLISPFLALLLIAQLVWQGYSVLYLYTFVARQDTAGGYGVPFRYWRQTVDMVERQLAAEKTDQVWVVAEGVDIAYEEVPLILDYLLGPDAKAVFLGQGSNESMLLPAGRPGIYLLGRESAPVQQMLRRLKAQERGLVVFPNNRTTMRLQVSPAYPVDQMLALIPRRELRAFDYGLRLLGFDWPDPAVAGQTARFATYWTFLDIPPEERYVQHSLFNHLIAPDGQRVAQRDGLGLPERYWAEGLLLVQWFDMVLPADLTPGDYTLLTGVYRLSDLARSRLIDEAGQDIGDSVSLHPVLVTR